MKKCIFTAVIFIFISFISFNSLFIQENYSHYKKILNIDQGNSIKIIISPGSKKPLEAYQILKKYLTIYNGNIYCDIINDDSAKLTYIRYAYFTDTNIFDNYELADGRFLTLAENESSLFLSTKNTKNTDQVGTLVEFAGDNDYEFYTLKTNLSINIFNRSFYLQIERNKLDLFIDDLAQEEIIIQNVPEVYNDDYNNSNIYIIGACFFILTLLLIYDLFNSYKKIAIEKMLGYSKWDIWIKHVIPMILSALLTITFITFLLIVYNFNVYNNYFISFLISLLKQYGVMLFIFIIFMTIPLLIVKKISISNMLKNIRFIPEIIVLNLIVKTVVSIAFLVLALNQYEQFKIIRARYIYAFEDWEKTKEYVVIPEKQTVADAVNVIESYSDKSKIIEQKLFLAFNKKGAIYANFSYYSPNSRKEIVSSLKQDYKTDYVIVNPNYLKRNQINDEKGNTVDIAETESEYILLIPVKYRNKETEIMEYHNFLKKGYNSTCNDPNCRHDSDSHIVSKVAEQSIKIIWTKTNQSYFSYCLDINPEEGNRVKDPIARVITESNGDLIDYYKITGYMGDPFKIKLSSHISDPALEILPEIAKYYDLKSHKFPIINVYDSVAEQIKKSNEYLGFTLIITAISLTIIVILIFQNVVVYIEQYKKRIAIQRFHGYKKRDKYKKFFIFESTNWLIITIITAFISMKFETIVLIVFYIIIEIILSLLMFKFIEKKRIILVAKGG